MSASESQSPIEAEDEEETKGQAKEAFTEEDKRHEDITKFYRRYYIVDKKTLKIGVEHMGEDLEIKLEEQASKEVYLLIDEERYKLEVPPIFPKEIMHEQRQMTIKLDRGDKLQPIAISINGVNFNALPHADNKNPLTEEDKRHEDDSAKFYRRY